MNFTAMGRWDKDQTQFPASYTNGWPIAGIHFDLLQPRGPAKLAMAKIWVQRATLSIRLAKPPLFPPEAQHPGVVNVCFGDGHVISVGDTIDLAVWRALGTRNGGENVPSNY